MKWAKPQRRALKAFLRDGSREHLRSVLAQTYQNFEVVIVGDHCTDDTGERVRALGDPRIRFRNLPMRSPYPKYRDYFWMTAGSIPMNIALDECRGRWIVPLDDDDEFTRDHIEVLLGACLRNRWEFCYGVMEMETEPGVFRRVGSYPLEGARICHSSVLYSAMLNFLRLDPLCWLLGEPADWNMWKKMRDIGVRCGFADRVVGVHYLERTAFRREELE